jgi:hypothetical protein
MKSGEGHLLIGFQSVVTNDLQLPVIFVPSASSNHLKRQDTGYF